MINFRLNYLSLPRAAERNSLGAQQARSETLADDISSVSAD